MRNRLNDIDWNKVQEKHNTGVYWNNLPKLFGFSRGLLNKALKLGLMYKILHERVHTKETRELQSRLKITFLKNNPESHPWKMVAKFKSSPCEKFKDYLRSNEINFVEEFQPLENRFYNIDISFPNEKIGIEINGNQHYNRSGDLKSYYQDRHDLIEIAGWKLYEIHYSKVYDEEFLKEFLEKLKHLSLEKLDYSFYIKEKKYKRKHCLDCSKLIGYGSVRCRACKNSKPQKRKFEITKEELEILIKEKPYTAIGKMFGVTDNAIKRRARKLGIVLENRLGFWEKIYHKES